MIIIIFIIIIIITIYCYYYCYYCYTYYYHNATFFPRCFDVLIGLSAWDTVLTMNQFEPCINRT